MYKRQNQVSPTIFSLMAAIDAKDSFTFEHSENVSKYAEMCIRDRQNMVKKISASDSLHVIIYVI